MEASPLPAWRTTPPKSPADFEAWLQPVAAYFGCDLGTFRDAILTHIPVSEWVPGIQKATDAELWSWLEAYKKAPLGTQDPHQILHNWCYCVCGAVPEVAFERIRTWAKRFGAESDTEVVLALRRHRNEQLQTELQKLVQRLKLPTYPACAS